MVPAAFAVHEKFRYVRAVWPVTLFTQEDEPFDPFNEMRTFMVVH
jgi:hypothetical protein